MVMELDSAAILSATEHGGAVPARPDNLRHSRAHPHSWPRRLWSAFALGVMRSHPYTLVLRYIIPYARLSFYYTAIRGWQYQQGQKLLRPGDILLATDRWKLASMLIPGKFAHAALCVARGEPFEVAEMTRNGFTKSTFFDICKEADRVVILRCRDWTEEYIPRVIACCRRFQNMPYDVTFQMGAGGLYCATLVALSDPEHRLDIEYGNLLGTGRPYIHPGSIYEASNVDVIWDSETVSPDDA